jgi:hypothetical protein
MIDIIILFIIYYIGTEPGVVCRSWCQRKPYVLSLDSVLHWVCYVAVNCLAKSVNGDIQVLGGYCNMLPNEMVGPSLVFQELRLALLQL